MGPAGQERAYVVRLCRRAGRGTKRAPSGGSLGRPARSGRWRTELSIRLMLVKRNDLKYERNEIIALLAKALLEKAVSRNYVRGANS
jgi:hypothetical protein